MSEPTNRPNREYAWPTHVMVLKAMIHSLIDAIEVMRPEIEGQPTRDWYWRKFRENLDLALCEFEDIDLAGAAGLQQVVETVLGEVKRRWPDDAV